MNKILYSTVLLLLTFQIARAQNTDDLITTDSIEYINEETLGDLLFEDIGGDDIYIETDTIYPFEIVDVKPRLKGCKKTKSKKLENCFIHNIMQHITKNFKYPPVAREQNIEEKIYIKLIFNKEGTISDITCVRGENKLLIESSIKAFEGLEMIAPAYHLGKPVSVEYIFPIRYQIK